MKYKVVYEYYAGMGDYGIDERFIESREELLKSLNNVFRDDIMINAIKIYRLNPNGEYLGEIDYHDKI